MSGKHLAPAVSALILAALLTTAGLAWSSPLTHPTWGYSITPPPGWKFQSGPDGAVLGHDQIAGMILVFPHAAANPQALQALMSRPYNEGGLQLMPAGTVRQTAPNTLTGQYQGTADGRPVKGEGIGLASPGSGGALILALATPQVYSDQLAQAAWSVARSVQWQDTGGAQLISHFAGTWSTWTKNTQRWVTLHPDGRYEYKYESSYGGQFHNQYGDQTGNWGAAGGDRDQGRWTARGDIRQGVLIFTSNKGGQTTVNYRVHSEGNKIYSHEYYFDNVMWFKKGG